LTWGIRKIIPERYWPPLKMITAEDLLFYTVLITVFAVSEVPFFLIGIAVTRAIYRRFGHHLWVVLFVAAIRGLLYSPTLLRYHGFALVPTVIAPYWWLRFPRGFGVELLLPAMLVFVFSCSFTLIYLHRSGKGIGHP